MRTVSAVWQQLTSSSHAPVTVVESYAGGAGGGVLLAADVPLLDGAVTFDDAARQRRRLSIRVPALSYDGAGRVHDWDPGADPAHPLAAYGQRLRVRTGVRHPSGYLELIPQGWYLIDSWQLSETDGSIDVLAVDLVDLVTQARLYAPYSVPAGQTLASVFASLVAGTSLPSRVDGLTDRPAPAGLTFARERDQAIDQVVQSWPGRWYVEDGGTVVAAPNYPPVSTSPIVRRLVDGAGGTVVQRQRSGQRRTPNAVVVDGQVDPAGTGLPPHAVAQLTTGPLAVSGPYGNRPRFYSSGFLASQGQAQETADEMLARLALLAGGRTEQVTCSPDAALELGDVVQVQTAGDSFTGRVLSLTLPLTADGGPMTLAVANAPEDEEE